MQPSRGEPTTLSVIAGSLRRIGEDLKEVREDGKVTRAKVEMLNDWHNRVNGALAVLAALGLASFAAILKVLLDSL